VRFPVIPYIGPEIVEVLRASSELAFPILPKRSAASIDYSKWYWRFIYPVQSWMTLLVSLD
jgi:hypothetical protein